MRNLNPVRAVSLFFVIVLLSITAVACGGTDKDENRRDDVDARLSLFDRAKALHPVPVDQIQNFPLRAALVEFTLRQDALNHPWFIYVYSMTGEPLGYYVGKTYPQSACNFLSSSQDLVDVPHDGDSIPDFQVSAPSVDGMFYSGSGSNAACESLFFFDASTDAMITFTAPMWVATDQPFTNFTGSQLGPTNSDDVVPADLDNMPEAPPAETPTPTASETPE